MVLAVGRLQPDPLPFIPAPAGIVRSLFPAPAGWPLWGIACVRLASMGFPWLGVDPAPTALPVPPGRYWALGISSASELVVIGNPFGVETRMGWPCDLGWPYFGGIPEYGKSRGECVKRSGKSVKALVVYAVPVLKGTGVLWGNDAGPCPALPATAIAGAGASVFQRQQSWRFSIFRKGVVVGVAPWCTPIVGG